MIPLELPLYDLDGWTGNVTDDFGCDWVITKEDGWGSAADARANLQDYPDADGADDAPTYEGPRAITLEGTCIAPNWAEQNRAKDRLNRVAYTSTRNLYPLTVTESHMTRLAYVRRSGAQKVDDRQGFGFDFSISLVAPDPRKYAADLTSLTVTMPGAAIPVGRTYPRVYPITYPAVVSYQPVINAFNAGTRRTGAQIAITSGLDNPGVIHQDSGAVLQFGVSLGGNDTLVLDLAAKTAVLNGTASRRGALLTGSSWFMLASGDNNLRLVGIPNGTGNPAMTVNYRSAWK